MKRILTLLSAFVLVLGVNAYAADEVEIYIDNERLECENIPVNINDRVLVPMRAIFEVLDAEVSWNAESRTVKAERNGEFMYIPVDTNSMTTGVYNTENDEITVESIYLDVPSMIIDDRTYVPIRAVSEALSADVSWDGENNRVIIDSRRNEDGVVYYTSNSDYRKLYSVGKNGNNRQKLSDKSVNELEMYNGSVYYTSSNENYLYKANADNGEECIIKRPINKLNIDENGWLYYQDMGSNAGEYGLLCRINLDSGESQQLTNKPVRYPLRYKGYLYFNLDNDNNMYAMKTDGTDMVSVSLGDSEYVKLYPFNCFFFEDNILVENSMQYGNIVKMDLDGSNIEEIASTINSIICRNIAEGDKVIYINPMRGQDIYYANLDGTGENLVLSADSTWLGMEVLARYGNEIYYKNPMRGEVYRVKLDGSNNTYVCYADEIKIVNDRLFLSYNGLYTGSPDAHDLKYIYDRRVGDFEIKGSTIYLKDEATSKLYMLDFDGKKNVVTADSVDEWVCE